MSTALSTLFGDNLMDTFDAFNTFDRGFFRDFRNMDRMLYGKNAQRMMKTDVTENDGGYRVDVDLPGFDKKDIQVELDDGYLTITASKSVNEDENGKNGRPIRRERYTGEMQRTFYVGDQLTEEDIHASYENGVLCLNIPRKEAIPAPKKHTICIEG